MVAGVVAATARPEPTPVRPPQFVVVSFDGSGGERMWTYWRAVARRAHAHFTFFVVSADRWRIARWPGAGPPVQAVWSYPNGWPTSDARRNTISPMGDPTDDVRAGRPRLPRARRNRLEEQAHVRDVLLALGGSTEELDRAQDQSANDASLGARISAYSRIAYGVRAPAVPEDTVVEAPPAPPQPPATAPLEVVRPEPARRPERRPQPRRRRAAGRQLRHLVFAIARAPWALLQGLVRAMLALVRAFRGLAAALVRVVFRAVRGLWLAVARATALLRRLLIRAVDVVRLLARVLLRAVHAVRSLARVAYRATSAVVFALPRATAALTRPRRVRRSRGRDEPTHVAEAVLTWVQPRPEPSDEPPAVVASDADVSDAVASTAAYEADVASVEVRPPVHRSDRRRRAPAGGLAVVAAFVVAGVVAGVLALTRHNEGGGQTQGGSAQAVGSPPPVPARAEFSDPRKYAAAMTRLALVSGRTEVDGSPACAQNSTFDRWTCRARGKPTLGAYAGVWLMYRCSPSSTPQPGGRPASVMINCTPQKPPSATA